MKKIYVKDLLRIIKNSKLMRTLAYITKIRIKLDVPALPEGRGQDN